MPRDQADYDYATPEIQRLLDQGARFVAVSGIRLLNPGSTDQLHDGGPSAARTAIGYNRANDEMYVFQGGNYTPDNMQDLFRGLGRGHRDSVGRRRLLGDRVAPRHRWHVGRRRAQPERQLRHPVGAVRLA